MSAPSAINNMRDILVGATPSTNIITTTALKSAAFQASTNVGEIAAFTPGGLRILEAGSSPVVGVSVAATANMDFVLAVSRGAALPPLVSDVIKGASVTSAVSRLYSAATEQSVAIGYNGTSGSILDTAVYAGDVYTVKMILQQFLSGSDDERIKRGDYKSLTTDGQAEVALGVVKSLNLNMAREVKNSAGNPPVIAKAVVNTPLANDFAFDNNAADVTVTKGGSQILFAAAPTYNTGTALVVGDYIRIGSATDTNGTVALLSNTYKVVSAVSTVLFELDRPVTAVSGTYVDTGGNITVIPSATGLAANWGIILLGQPLPWSISKKKYAKVRLAVQPNSSFGSTVMGNITNAYEGTGTYEQVAELENFLQGFKGEQYEMGQPYLFDDATNLRLASSAVTGGGYDLVTIVHSSSIVNFSVDVAKKELIIAIPATTPNFADAGTTDSLLEVLTDIIAVPVIESYIGNATANTLVLN